MLKCNFNKDVMLQPSFPEKSRQNLCSHSHFEQTATFIPGNFPRKHLWRSLLLKNLQLPVSANSNEDILVE